MKKKIPIGIDHFRKLFAADEEERATNPFPYYYVDKTLLVQRILDDGADVTLFTRPRRFGKSLNISMLQYFFENLKKDEGYIFDDLKISQAGEDYQKHKIELPPLIALTV